MHTFFIISIGILILSSIARGIYLEANNDNLNGLEFLHIWAGLLVLAISIVFIVSTNKVEESISSKTIVSPSRCTRSFHVMYYNKAQLLFRLH